MGAGWHCCSEHDGVAETDCTDTPDKYDPSQHTHTYMSSIMLMLMSLMGVLCRSTMLHATPRCRLTRKL